MEGTPHRRLGSLQPLVGEWAVPSLRFLASFFLAQNPIDISTGDVSSLAPLVDMLEQKYSTEYSLFSTFKTEECLLVPG